MASIAKSPLNVIFGAAAFGDKSVDVLARFDTPDEINSVLDTLIKRGYNHLDSSRMYGQSEARLATVSAGDRFIIDTKVASNPPGQALTGLHTKEKVLAEIDTSLETLKVKQVNVEYLHAPDRSVPFAEACEAMNQAYQAGKFKKWGLSNFAAHEVQEIIEICEKNGWVKPSVYQGHYNAIVRGAEKDLVPVLRKNGIAFYAYSPSAGGFFAANPKAARKGGRFDTTNPIGGLYASLYVRDSILTATEPAIKTLAKHGIDGHAAALRWIVHHSILDSAYGDSVVMGCSTLKQVESNLDVFEQGPLPEEVVAAFDAVYAGINPDEVPPHHL